MQLTHSATMVLSFALVVGRSPRAAAFAKNAAVQQQSKLSMSFFEDFGKSFQRAFSAEASDSEYYTVGITGSTGLLGTALIDELGKQETLNGKPIRIVKFKRSDSVEDTGELGAGPVVSVNWNPKAETAESVIDPKALASIDAIVNLAGENVATGLGPLGFLGIRPWSDDKKNEILNSRVVPTRGLAKAIAASKTPTTFLSTSGVGIYGADFIGESSATADEKTDTSSTTGFLAEVSRQWEAAAEDAGKNRVAICRMGVVMSKKAGALAKLFPIFFLGGGGVLASGQQYFSFISARDAARAFVYILSTPSIKGPINVCAPNPCTNSEFTVALGDVLNRPTILPFPNFAVSLLFGEMGDEMLSGGVKAVPSKLTESGFQFQHPSITEALQSACDETI